MPSGDPFPPKTHLKKLLVRGVNWLGDAVMTTPALQRLREYFPTSQIILLTAENLAELWAHHPSIDSCLVFQRTENPWSVARRLRVEAFDAALVLPNSPRSALEVWLAGIPRRVGAAHSWRNWFLTCAVKPRANRGQMRKRSSREIRNLVANPAAGLSPIERRSGSAAAHQIHEYLHLVAALGANPVALPPTLEVAAPEVHAARLKFLAELPAASTPSKAEGPPVWLGLNPSAAYGPAKCWPVERFAEVVRVVSQRRGRTFWLIFGRQEDRPICERVAQMSSGRAANLAGRTSLRELMALLKICSVVLTNDSGPMHVAAALGNPVVVPFGSTSPDLTGPGVPEDPRHRLLLAGAACSPCFRRACPIDLRCMTGITVDSVVSAVLDALTLRS
jgi:heptosyltransferase-2